MNSNYIHLPVPKIRLRKLNNKLRADAMNVGLHPAIATILAARPILEDHLSKVIEPKLADLEHPYKMQDMLIAAKRVARAIVHQEHIGIETDHDCDGQTSHAVIYYNLTKHFKHPKNLIKSYIGHRLTEGYGLSTPVVNKILADFPKVSLLITADNGSSDEPRIAKLKEQGIDVIVTDHHQIPVTGFPQSAYAFINPTREDCSYDPYIAGCMVAWLLMVATRLELISIGYLKNDAPKLIDTLDYVAVGTVADCVSFAKSYSNRAIVKFGLQLINSRQKFCWQALNNLLPHQITTEDLGFKIGPLLNSDGRLSTAFGSVSFLLSEDLVEAHSWLQHLQEQNKQRRQIQNSLTLQGLEIAKQQFDNQRYSVSIFLQEGHLGVHGISASKIKDCFGRPVAFFAPKISEDHLISGSIRGVDHFHVRQALQYIADQDPQLLITFGGHQGAGGVTLMGTNFHRFAELFEQAAFIQLSFIELWPIIWSDGVLPKELINLNFLENLKILEPYGREFESPIFHNTAIINEIKIIGDGTHAKFHLNIDGKIFKGVWFNMRHSPHEPCCFVKHDKVICAFRLLENNFANNKNCELQIINMQRMCNNG
jgi:single-stranded-DNA-specific exonuclease